MWSPFGGLASITCTSRKLSVSLYCSCMIVGSVQRLDSRYTVCVGYLSSSVHQCSRTLSRPVPSVTDNLSIMTTGTIVRIFVLKTISAGCYAGQKEHDNGQISLTSTTILCTSSNRMIWWLNFITEAEVTWDWATTRNILWRISGMSGEPGEYGILTASEIKEGHYENYERDKLFVLDGKKKK